MDALSHALAIVKSNSRSIPSEPPISNSPFRSGSADQVPCRFMISQASPCSRLKSVAWMRRSAGVFSPRYMCQRSGGGLGAQVNATFTPPAISTSEGILNAKGLLGTTWQGRRALGEPQSCPPLKDPSDRASC